MSRESLPPTVRNELNDAGDAFAGAWNEGQRPRIEEYICSRTEPERTVLLETLLRLELAHRREAGETPEPQEYLERFDADTEVIRTVFNNPDPDRTADWESQPPTERGPNAAPPVHLTTTIPATTVASPLHQPPGPEDPAILRMPARIGRYRVIRHLGRGNFEVYLARDEQNRRDVAIKTARSDDPLGRTRLMSLADEAEKLRNLNHPRIIKLYEYVPPCGDGGEDNGFIVLEYIEGQTLEALFQTGVPPAPRMARIAGLIADAVHSAHIHRAGLVHRDLKPSNILLDVHGEPHVCDFGLAVNEEVQRLRRGEVAGTLPYMAPEQVRGETHRLDGRTDIWALGVILYRGLTGRLPFPGHDCAEIFEEILHRDPRPPRMYVPGLDPELERICLRCLSRPMSERYLTAADLAADLKRASSDLPPLPIPAQDAIVPKGLRPFDIEDARSFLALLPGPRRGDGMPESVRFWKDWIEALNSDKVFSVGLLYGPSGGGKSSFVNAGLLPRLERDRVQPVYVEATPEGTETRLLAAIHRQAPNLPVDVPLPDSVALLRDDIKRRSAAKTLLVLDQFEQWLQARPDLADAELVRALRQCDGLHVQALVLVRDDFWMAVTRLFRALDVPLVQGRNAAAVELFDARHARKVLGGFGQALGQVLENGDTGETQLFLDEAVHGLTGPDDRVIPVRLCLLTEVVRHRPWTPATLRILGGVDGIGVKFLDDCFASAPYRRFRGAAQAVLEKLLPAPTSAIRGRPRDGRDLRAASGYADQPGEFAEIIRVLGSELRLVVAAAPDHQAPAPCEPGSTPSEEAGQTYYQLAHDYLVRPIRQWLERDQRASARGRAQLRLAYVTASWLERPGRRQLPSLLEWVGILRYTRPGAWSGDERHVMRAAARYFFTRGVAALLVLAAIALGIKSMLDHERTRAVFLRAIKSEPRDLRGLFPEITAHRDRLRLDLERVESDRSAPVRERANAVLLLHRDRPTVERAMALRARLAEAGPDEVELIRDVLAADLATAGGDLLHRALRDDSGSDAVRLRIACVLAHLGPVETEAWKPAANALMRGLLGEDRRTVPQWLALLAPVHAIIVPPLASVCGDAACDPTTRTTAAEALAGTLSAQRDPAALARSLIGVLPDASLILLRELEQMNDKGVGLAVLHRAFAEAPSKPRDDRDVERQALAAVALAVLGQPDALRQAVRHQVDPRLRTQTIQKIATLRLAPRVLHERLPWAELDGAERQAVLLAWAETPPEVLPPAIRATVLNHARQTYLDDRDPGVHSASELLIRRWSPGPLPALKVGARKPPGLGAGGRGWETGPNGHTLVALRGPLEFRMGSPKGEPKRFPYETQHECRIERSLLVATTETTVEQYRAYKDDYVPDSRYSSEPGCPAGGVSWYDALRYCNWLSRKAGLEPFFPDDVKPGTQLPKGKRDGGGFRLPTETEWEYACRAHTETCRQFGESEQFLDRHTWTWLNSHERLSPAGRLLPNEFGLFDMLGSQWEWCLDGSAGSAYYPPYPEGTKDRPALDDFRGVPVNNEDWRIVRGGCFDSPPSMARSAHRDIFVASHSRYYNGFRVVRTVTPDQESRE